MHVYTREHATNTVAFLSQRATSSSHHLSLLACVYGLCVRVCLIYQKGADDFSTNLTEAEEERKTLSSAESSSSRRPYMAASLHNSSNSYTCHTLISSCASVQHECAHSLCVCEEGGSRDMRQDVKNIREFFESHGGMWRCSRKGV